MNTEQRISAGCLDTQAVARLKEGSQPQQQSDCALSRLHGWQRCIGC
jgi:hypothetical protein